MHWIDSEAAMGVALFMSTASMAWAVAWAWSRWLNRPRQLPPASDESERRLARLEMAMEAVAIEVERIGEAQRYTARLLEERLPAARPALPRAEAPKSITPH